MPFKTKEEMFGDGGGFGAAVPYSVTNPPGTGAGNRGTQFGEQLTAAIANRAPYALAVNDEDLNARLAAFEVGGLDAAYDNGAVGPAGGGRQINRDSGAIETLSTKVTTYDDISNAHFRANAMGNTTRGGGGFEFVGKGRGAGGDALYGFMDRRRLALSTGGSNFGEGVAALLNPGGAGGTQVSLNAGSVHTAGATGLVLGFDLVEISGTAGGTYDGLYIVNTLVVGQNARCNVIHLDGTSPSFPANTAAVVDFFRPTFGSFVRAGHNNAAGYYGTTVAGMPGIAGALEVLSGTPSPGGDAFVVRTALASGAVVSYFTVNPAGNVWMNGTLAVDDLAEFYNGLYVDAGFATINDGVVAPSFDYLTPQTRFVNIDIALGAPRDEFAGDLPSYSYWDLAAAGAGLLYVPLTPFVPTGATIVAAEVLLETGLANDASVVIRVRQSNFAAYPAVPTHSITLGASAPQHPTASRQVVRALAPAGAVSNATQSVGLSIYGGMSTNTLVYAIRVEFTDPGPRNY
jgi:hypothetical protein